MIILEITINELREVDSIKLKINDSLVEYLNKEEGIPIVKWILCQGHFKKID